MENKMIDMISDTYTESVMMNEKDAFNFLCDAAEKRLEDKDDFKTTYKPLTEVITIVRGRKKANLPMLTAQEELAEDYLEEWAELFGAENAK